MLQARRQNLDFLDWLDEAGGSAFPPGWCGFLLRLGFLVTAFVYLYVYNAAREGVRRRRLSGPLCRYRLGMIALGWIGVLKPTFAGTTPVEMLLPDSLVPSSVSGPRVIG